MKLRWLFLLLFAGVVQANTYPLKINFGPISYDTIWVVHHDGSLAPADSFLTSGYSVDTTYEITSGFAQFLVRYKNGADDYACYREDYNALLTEVGPIYWHVPVFARDPIDSIVTDSYENGSIVSSTLQTLTNNSVDYSRLVVRDTSYRLTHRIFYSGRDSAISYVNLLHWDSLGTSIIAPPLAHTCIVYGYVGNTAGLKTQYATITFTMPEAANDTCTGVIILDRVSVAQTDAAGYFADTLIWSSCLGVQGVRTNSPVQYQVTIEYPNKSPLKRSLTVPDSSSYRVKW